MPTRWKIACVGLALLASWTARSADPVREEPAREGRDAITAESEHESADAVSAGLALGDGDVYSAESGHEGRGGDPSLIRQERWKLYLRDGVTGLKHDIQKALLTDFSAAGLSREQRQKLERLRSPSVSACLKSIQPVAGDGDSAYSFLRYRTDRRLPIRIEGACPHLKAHIDVEKLAERSTERPELIAQLFDLADAFIRGMDETDSSLEAPFRSRFIQASSADPALQASFITGEDGLKSLLLRYLATPEGRAKFGRWIDRGLLEDVRRSRYVLRSSCRDASGRYRAATANSSERNGPVCFNWAYMEWRGISKAELLGLGIHEHLHHFGENDSDHAYAAAAESSFDRLFQEAPSRDARARRPLEDPSRHWTIAARAGLEARLNERGTYFQGGVTVPTISALDTYLPHCQLYADADDLMGSRLATVIDLEITDFASGNNYRFAAETDRGYLLLTCQMAYYEGHGRKLWMEPEDLAEITGGWLRLEEASPLSSPP